jgi:GH15 family glucan-1,4-alpha-glucosidase
LPGLIVLAAMAEARRDPRIEDYALLGNCHTSALVARDGAIDWLCLPRFDSPACFARLLGTDDNGYWQIAPALPVKGQTRRYRDDTLVLETDFETEAGAVRVIDCLPFPTVDGEVDLVRVVKGLRGRVPMHGRFTLRFDYGRVVPWVRHRDYGIHAIAGPDAVQMATPVELRGEDMATVCDFAVAAGEEVPFLLTWRESHRLEHPPEDPFPLLRETEQAWCDWAKRCRYEGRWCEAVQRSLLTLKALIYAPTGGIAAAATTSLPERIGGVRNWDYRYCWIRDATFTLYSLLVSGYTDEARAWREWLLRAAAGDPARLQIMYGLSGHRRLPELELPWLAGFAGSRPVRIGNAASTQHQLDVYGELMDSFHTARKFGIEPTEDAWRVQKVVLDYLEGAWDDPDEGIWEIRGHRRHFTHSKVMAWVALDRAVRDAQRFGLDGPVERWRALRDHVHADVCAKGFHAGRNTFVQYYGGSDPDAALLMLPLVGFLPCDDPRMLGTIAAIRRELMQDGLVHRYVTRPEVDGLPPGEGAFIACTFWLADCLAMLGEIGEATAIFERLLDLRNDVGLLAEEYDPVRRRMLGNFPQAYSHVGLVNTAHNIATYRGPARERPK